MSIFLAILLTLQIVLSQTSSFFISSVSAIALFFLLSFRMQSSLLWEVSVCSWDFSSTSLSWTGKDEWRDFCGERPLVKVVKKKARDEDILFFLFSWAPEVSNSALDMPIWLKDGITAAELWGLNDLTMDCRVFLWVSEGYFWSGGGRRLCSLMETILELYLGLRVGLSSLLITCLIYSCSLAWKVLFIIYYTHTYKIDRSSDRHSRCNWPLSLVWNMMRA